MLAAILESGDLERLYTGLSLLVSAASDGQPARGLVTFGALGPLLDPDLRERARREAAHVTEADASATGFTGSPTILVDGVDVAPATAENEASPLTCRVYRRRDGRISPTPDREALREALQRALEVTT